MNAPEEQGSGSLPRMNYEAETNVLGGRADRNDGRRTGDYGDGEGVEVSGELDREGMPLARERMAEYLRELAAAMNPQSAIRNPQYWEAYRAAAMGRGTVSNTRPTPDPLLAEIPAETQANARTNTRQPAQVTEQIDLDSAFNYESQLWRLETYRDKKNERTVVKRVIRFVRKRTGYNLGEATEELAEKLAKRPGKGRTAKAREEAERSRFFAERLAKRLRRTARGRRSNAVRGWDVQWQTVNPSEVAGSELLFEMPDLSQYERTAYVQ